MRTFHIPSGLPHHIFRYQLDSNWVSKQKQNHDLLLTKPEVTLPFSMNKNIRNFFLVLAFLTPAFCCAEQFLPNSSYQVCFTPGQNCTQMIADEISKAKKQILVQMYTFTSVPIANALVDAKNRGVDVKILLDKTQASAKYSLTSFFINNGIFTRIDRAAGIAHNKLVLIDNTTTIGGSFNHTVAAQKSNVENVTIIRDTGFTKYYIKNWFKREQNSMTVDEYRNRHTQPAIKLKII